MCSELHSAQAGSPSPSSACAFQAHAEAWHISNTVLPGRLFASLVPSCVILGAPRRGVSFLSCSFKMLDRWGLMANLAQADGNNRRSHDKLHLLAHRRAAKVNTHAES